MKLAAGARLGPYEILSPQGAGGMGEVFRARDTRLNREVALKLLPEAFAQDKGRLARFRKEAHVLASLNHPSIAAIHGLEELDRVVVLALELVEGEDLAERLKRGAIPAEEATLIAKQIAEGLEAAHEHGIVHRDLEPANIKLAKDGAVKLLDFGLAKALEGETTEDSLLSQSPTLSRQMTEAGIILGTAAYMSPEQARGKPVDERADVWSFGVVLYEMLAGRRLFHFRDRQHAVGFSRWPPDRVRLRPRRPRSDLVEAARHGGRAGPHRGPRQRSSSRTSIRRRTPAPPGASSRGSTPSSRPSPSPSHRTAHASCFPRWRSRASSCWWRVWRVSFAPVPASNDPCRVACIIRAAAMNLPACYLSYSFRNELALLASWTRSA